MFSRNRFILSDARKRPSTILATSFILLILFSTLILSWKNSNQLGNNRSVWMDNEEHYAKTNQWRFAIVSDLDENSKVESEGNVYWRSWLQKGNLKRNSETGKYQVVWDEKKAELKTVLNENGRAMELSDLVKFNNRLYACDDRTGIVYEITDYTNSAKAYPRHILMDGDGNSPKGFKCEWSSEKDGLLYIGSFGKEYTKDGEIISNNPMWIKILDDRGIIQHVHWDKAWRVVREATGTEHPGYLFHESVNWNNELRRWFFLPRRLSKDPYHPKLDEYKGANVLISTDENFEDSKLVTIGSLEEPTHGFSAFRFIPGRKGEILALKTEELGLNTASYITIFNVEGKVLLEETLIAKGFKYEGLEFLGDSE